MYKNPRSVILTALFAASAAAGAPAASPLDQAVAQATPRATELRHRIRQNPELGNREFETAKLVAAHLKGLGFEVRTGVAHTGVIGILRGSKNGGKPGPTVAVRADMDALPVTEQTDLPFKSTKRTMFGGKEVGVAHACGHDVHTAVQLGVASVLAGMRAELAGTVLLIFQPAEEGPPPGEEGGAKLMLKEGLFDEFKPAVIFGLHTFPDWEVGTVALMGGASQAASDTWRATIHGKQAHGAWPHLAVDPVVMAAEAVTALQTIRSRNVDPTAAAVVTVGVIRGGERFNIIPEKVELEGTVRTYDPAVQDLIERRMREILDGVTRAGGGRYELSYERNNPALINDAALAEWARARLVARLGADRITDNKPVMGAEDFAWFSQRVPGLYFRLGATKPGTVNSGLHTPTYRPDDGAIPVGIRAMAGLVIDYLANPPAPAAR
jgi:amidohydrolase